MAKAGKRVAYVSEATRWPLTNVLYHMLKTASYKACSKAVVAPAERSAVHPQAQAYLDALPPNMPMPETDIPLPMFRAAVDARTK